MRIRICADQRILSGTPTELVQQMHELAFGAQHLSLSEYVDWAAGMARDMLGLHLEISGDTADLKATSLVTAMLQTGLADELEEELVN